MTRMTLIRCLVGVATALTMALTASSASAIEFDAFGGAYSDDAGDPVRQAGAHPDVRVRFLAHSELVDGGASGQTLIPVELPHRMLADMPAGLVGNPAAMPTCPETRLKSSSSGFQAACPIGSQIGVAKVYAGDLDNPTKSPVYNIERPVGTPGLFAFNALGVVVRLTPTVRAGDYGITMDSGTISQGLAINGAEIDFWGVPADPAHDPDRFAPMLGGAFYSAPASTQSPRVPFLTLPTSCPGTPAVTTGRLDGWESVGNFATASFSSDLDDVPFTLNGCEKLAFDPSVDVKVTSRVADAPTGLDLDLSVPQNESPDGLATAHVKDVSVTLPEGMALSPAAAGGLAACSDAQLDIGSTDIERCPEASKVGTVEIDSPLLEESLGGSMYVGTQQSGDPMSGRMFRLFLVASGSGVRIKLEGGVTADPQTGRLTATFASNPQQPFSQLRVRMFGGPRAALVNPPSCGTKTINVHMTSWSGKAVDRQSRVEVDCRPGLGGFSPSLVAGATNPLAGGFSPFVVGIAKPDGQSALDGLSMELPEGVLAKLKGNLNSQVGTVTAFAGTGESPFPLPGTVVLEGPYGDAPYSLRVTVPAKAGPYDLGEVVVRQRVYVDRTTAQVRVVSDPIPTIVGGVPTRLQRLDVEIDKPGFMVNPTSCEEQQVEATLRSAAGQSVSLDQRFQVGSCAALGFRPRLGMSLVGKRQRTTGKHPALRARLRQAGSQSAIDGARVVLPRSLALDPDNAQALCEFENGTKPDLENHCPEGSKVGRARAKTPLLERDLVGDVYFVKNVRRDKETGNEIRTLPMIVVALRGEIAINLRGKSSTTKNGKLVTTFANVPDAPVSAFNLNIKGGGNGILAVTRTRRAEIDLCDGRQIANLGFKGQNGKRTRYRRNVKTPCGKRKAAMRKAAKRKAAKRKANRKRASRRS